MEIHDINENEPHLTGELICLNCWYRYIGTWVEKVWMKDLYCPNCSRQGTTIATGQILQSEFDEDAPEPMPQSKPGRIKTNGELNNVYDISGQKVDNIIKLNQEEGEE